MRPGVEKIRYALADAWAGNDDIARLRQDLGDVLSGQCPVIDRMQERFERMHATLLAAERELREAVQSGEGD